MRAQKWGGRLRSSIFLIIYNCEGSSKQLQACGRPEHFRHPALQRSRLGYAYHMVTPATAAMKMNMSVMTMMMTTMMKILIMMMMMMMTMTVMIIMVRKLAEEYDIKNMIARSP